MLTKSETSHFILVIRFEQNPKVGSCGCSNFKVPSGENTELKCSPFKAWSRSVYSHTCYAYCQGFLPYVYSSSPFTCIFDKTSPDFFVLAVANTGSCVGPQNKIGHPDRGRFPC